MDRPSTRAWVLALALAACTNDSGSSTLAVQSVSVPDFGRWECNRPIEFAFDQRIDFATVSSRSIRIRTSAGVPAVGAFAPRMVDSNGDGVTDRADESAVVFHPSCPVADDLSDAGLTPGARYLVTVAGEDSDEDPASLLRSRSGTALAHTMVRAFETIADPASALFDEKPGAPAPLVRAARASTGPGCHLELGEDPSNQVFFEAGPVLGRTPSGFAAPLNLLGDPATHVAFVVVLDQAIRPSPANLAHLLLEYNTMLDVSGWTPLDTRAELVSECRPADPAVRLVPLGTFPPGGFVRVRIEAGFQDLVGESTPAPLDGFAITEVAEIAFSGFDPPGAIADELHEEFDFGAESPLSLADPAPPLDAVPAGWGEGELRAVFGFSAFPTELSQFDWVVRNRETFAFDTTATVIVGGPGGTRGMEQSTTGGLVLVRNLVVEQGGTIRVVGPNPMVVHALGSVSIRGVIDASGFDALALLQDGTTPGAGGSGAAGGGPGGSGSARAQARGRNGSAAFGAGAGGEGGESGFSVEVLGDMRRGGGGGGGRFARDQGSLVAENGGSGTFECTGAESGLSPPRGGARGPAVFLDDDPDNDFFGVEPVVDANGEVVAERRGELPRIHAGAGGGNGGDSVDSAGFPPPPNPARVLEGGGGGGGGGALVIRALGRIAFGPSGRIRANGGRGARRGTLNSFHGACGGSGSGGHVILESLEQIDFSGGNPSAQAQVWIEAVGGPRILQTPGPRGAGGAGGPGVVQLHVRHPERAPGNPGSNVILPVAELGQPDPLAAACKPRPVVLYPSAARSRGLSRWIPLGAAGEGSPVRHASVVGFLFDGIETAPGLDEGKVLTRGGRVVELAPLLGPANLAQPGIELLPDGSSLVLSGPVLAPLRASAEPISPDVYLRTPALLEGFTLRLANVSGSELLRDLTIAGARFDDATSRLTLSAGGLSGTLAEVVQELGGADQVELALVPRFFRVRHGSAVDLLPDSSSVRIRFQGAADDGTGRPDELDPLVDWTADVSRFHLLPPGALDFVRFRVDFDLDADEDGFDPGEEQLALEFLRLPMRF